jgi:hypothetical protein
MLFCIFFPILSMHKKGHTFFLISSLSFPSASVLPLLTLIFVIVYADHD